MNMKNENAKLDFIYSLLGSVKSYTDVTHKVPAKVYFNFPIPDLDIGDQKAVLTELKKSKVIKSFVWENGDFVVTKPSRSGMIDFLHRLKRPVILPEAPEQIDTAIKFDETTGLITKGTLKPCQITINTNQYFICKLLFRERFGTPVTETDILDAIDFAKESKRKVYDAMLAVNRKIKAYFGIEKFIRWKTGRVWIAYREN